jgi:hypothetical protein
MTAPTQAQIKAAREVLLQRRALRSEDVEAALTAAAQVGPQIVHVSSSVPIHPIDDAATIERCAQVAERMTQTSEFWRDDIAAAIRKLKDAP